MAKKKAAKKKTAKKKSAKHVTITFKCSSGCKPSRKHVPAGAHVTLEAKGTNATINFVSRTPFESGHKHIVVQAGHPKSEVVKATASGDYEYRLSCDSCSSKFGNPKMIVP